MLERELAEIMATAGTVTYGETNTVSLPIELILTDTADRDAARATLPADVDRNATGFDPVRDGDDVMVVFTATVVHRTRPA